jgi:biopolymer transport protein ExbD
MASMAAREGQLGMQLAPLLGLPFLLLLWLWLCVVSPKTAGLQEGSIATRLSFSGSHPRYVQVSIDDDGSVSIEGVPYDAVGQRGLPITIIQLKARLAQDPSLGVMIQPQPQTRQQRVVDVLTVCSDLGFRDIEFGSWPPKPPPAYPTL